MTINWNTLRTALLMLCALALVGGGTAVLSPSIQAADCGEGMPGGISGMWVTTPASIARSQAYPNECNAAIEICQEWCSLICYDAVPQGEFSCRPK